MPKQKTSLQELYERTAEKRDNPDKRDATEKVPTGEVNKNPENLSEYEENPGDVGPNTRVPAGSDPDISQQPGNLLMEHIANHSNQSCNSGFLSPHRPARIPFDASTRCPMH